MQYKKARTHGDEIEGSDGLGQESHEHQPLRMTQGAWGLGTLRAPSSVELSSVVSWLCPRAALGGRIYEGCNMGDAHMDRLPNRSVGRN